MVQYFGLAGICVFVERAARLCVKAFPGVRIAAEQVAEFGVFCGAGLVELNKEVANEGSGFSKENL
jgi:hypothetical protein